MSKYTTTIQEVIQNIYLAQKTRYPANNTPLFPIMIEELTKDEIYEIGKTLFPADYPFYSEDEDEKVEFEKSFIRHFYFYEIGQETVGQFKWYLEDFLYTRMPYYKQLYASQLTSLDEALKNMDIQRTETISGTAHSQSNGTSSSTSTGNSTDKSLQFPLNNQNLEEVGRGVSDSTDTSSGENQDTTDTTNSTSINARTSGMMSLNKVARTKDYRQLIISINELIFEDAKDNHLFMEIW